jgi:hypothetical protein
MSGRASIEIYAANKSADNHPKKRVVISYITLLIFVEMRRRGYIDRAARITLAGATLQSSQGVPKGYQGAHQNLGELFINDQPAYSLIQDGTLQQTLKYCFGVVSCIHKSYNWADDFVEARARRVFCHLAQDVVTWDIPPVDILGRVLTLFGGACRDALSDPNILAGAPSGKYTDMGWIAQCLNAYLVAVRELKPKIAVIAARPLTGWIDEIREHGLTPPPAPNAAAPAASGP